MPTYNTKWYRSNFSGAPVLTGQAGALLAVLNAVLVDGFGLVTLTSLVVAGNVATGTKTAHGLQLHQIIEIAGATPSGLNGKWRINSVTTDTFTFSTTGISDQTATGTITCKTPSAGWEKPFTATNVAIYRSLSAQASGNHAVKVTDTGTTTATLVAAEDWNDVNTAVNGIATQYLPKSTTADGTARGWFAVVDDRSLFIGIAWNGGRYDVFRWGDFASIIAGDGHAFEIRCSLLNSVAALGQKSSCGFAQLDQTYDVYGSISRPYSQIVGAIAAYQGSLAGALWRPQTEVASAINDFDATSASKAFCLSGHNGSSISATNLVSAATYGLFLAPNPGDGGMHFVPVFLFEGPNGSRKLRGTVRGLLHVLETKPLTSDFQILSGIEGVTGGLVLGIRTQNEVMTYNGGGSRAFAETHIAFDLGDWA